MQLNSSAVEQVTAATDLPLAVAALLAAAYLWHRRRTQPLKAALWSSMFGSLGVASGLGVFAHGLALDPAALKLIWHPINAALALTVACFVAGTVLDCRGADAARRALPGLLLLSVGFFLYATFVSPTFLPFVIYEGAAMLLCLAAYLTLAARHRLAGAGWLATGVLVTILAAALQATRAVSFTPAVPLDHNGVFHLIQLGGLLCLLAGLRKMLGQKLPDGESTGSGWKTAPEPMP